MFKKLVKMVSEIKTENDRDATFWQIDREFEQGKIQLLRNFNREIDICICSCSYHIFICYPIFI